MYGIVYMDGVCYATTTTTYVPAGKHNFNAFPYPGYVFAGWLIPGYPPDSYLFTYEIDSAPDDYGRTSSLPSACEFAHQSDRPHYLCGSLADPHASGLSH